MNPLIRTLIVDDSAFVRKFVREMLSRSPYIEVVGAARDGREALELVEQLKPDVITCDLTMPGMDGVEFVRQQMSRRRLPILILTASPDDGERAIEAMQAGAIDFLQKPSALATEELLTIREDLVERVKAAARAPMNLAKPLPGVPLAALPVPQRVLKTDALVIGISTGGPQGLRYLLPLFGADFPVPIAVVLHMPVGYTNLFAEKLNEVCALEVKEASEGDLMKPGTILLAQAGRHLSFRRAAGGYVVSHLSGMPNDTPHRPAVDVLFRSAAEIYGARVLAVVMTGMGNDGTKGAAWVKAQGGTVLTEAQETCVIYGMPRSVEEAGLSDASVPLHLLAAAIMERL
jgi:two-component system, chemotaxis family, protein-glutamate methylesterase/glutaminase